MEKSINDYDENLRQLERQREQLEHVMKMMGQEWEERGAGIGWLGSLPEPTEMNSPIITEKESAEEPTTEATETQVLIQPLISNILSSNSGPSPEYLQSLLHVNEVLLAQSLANTTTNEQQQEDNNTIMSTPLLTPVTTTMSQQDNFNTPPLITPDTAMDDTHLFDIESEKIISPLVSTNHKQLTSFTTSSSDNNHSLQF